MKKPTFPSEPLKELLEIAVTNPKRFRRMAKDAGHLNAATFYAMISRALDNKRATKPYFHPGSIFHYENPPDPALVQHFIDLERQAIHVANIAAKQEPNSLERKKTVRMMQDLYRRIYERERHELIYNRMHNKRRRMTLLQAWFDVREHFRVRATRLMVESDLPLDIRKAERAAMLGYYGAPITEVTSGGPIGPGQVFGALNIQNKRDGPAGGRRYWPFGKPHQED